MMIRKAAFLVFLVAACPALVLLPAGCGEETVEVGSVGELKERAEELLGRLVQVTGQFEYVPGDRRDEFRLKDPSQPSGEGVMVRCTPEDFQVLEEEMESLDMDRITLVGRVFRPQGADRELKLDFVNLAGRPLRWIILVSIIGVVLAITIVVVLLLRKPDRSVEDLIYMEEGQETVRRYGQISLFEGDRLVNMWFLSYDRSLTESRVTDVDMVLGTEGIVIGRENPFLGLRSMTVSRRVARLGFRPDSRDFVLTNLNHRKPLELSAGDGQAPRQIPPSKEVVLPGDCLLHIDAYIRLHFVRREDAEPGTGYGLGPA